MLREVYRNSQSCVLVDGEDSELFDLFIGVRQGDVLSPLLFKLFVNPLIKRLRELNLALDEDEIKHIFNCFLYADVIVLVGRSEEEMRLLLECLFKFCRQWRLEVNVKKSGVMIVCNEAEGSTSTDNYRSDLLPLVDKYKYLGVWFNKKWMWSDHIEYNCDRVEAKLNVMKFKLLRNSNIESQVKIIVWNNVFKPILMYASEIWR